MLKCIGYERLDSSNQNLLKIISETKNNLNFLLIALQQQSNKAGRTTAKTNK